MKRKRVLQNKILQRPSIGLSDFYFSSRIAARHALGQRSGRLPRLIFPKLKSLTWINKIININYTDSGTCSFGLYVNLYFKVPDVASATLPGFIATRGKTHYSLFLPLKAADLQRTALRSMGAGKSFIDQRHVLHSQVMLSHYLLHLLRNKRSKIYSGELREHTHPKFSPIPLPHPGTARPRSAGERLNQALTPFTSTFLPFLRVPDLWMPAWRGKEAKRDADSIGPKQTLHSQIMLPYYRAKLCQEAGELNQALIFNNCQALSSFGERSRSWPLDKGRLSVRGSQNTFFLQGDLEKFSRPIHYRTLFRRLEPGGEIRSAASDVGGRFQIRPLAPFQALTQAAHPIIPLPPLENQRIGNTTLVDPCPSCKRSGSVLLTATYALSPRLEGNVDKLEVNASKLKDGQSNPSLPPLEKGRCFALNLITLRSEGNHRVERGGLFKLSTSYCSIQTYQSTSAISPGGQKAPFFENLFVPHCPILNPFTPHLPNLLIFLSPTRERKDRYQVISGELIKEFMVVREGRSIKNSMIKSSCGFQNPALVRDSLIRDYGGDQEDRDGAGIHGIKREKYAVLPSLYEQNQTASIIMRKALPLLIAGGQSLPAIVRGQGLPDSRTGDSSPWPYGQGKIALVHRPGIAQPVGLKAPLTLSLSPDGNVIKLSIQALILEETLLKKGFFQAIFPKLLKVLGKGVKGNNPFPKGFSP